ncbi:hypothetical protein [uncultured Methanolobus sp.]|uniref:hypothetical protein n=1 Tax=uncultured Methanolobus sp. TaxID=218300 RepID=UPI002AAB7592|nr:hypothetical protein [uncultured Methanolobus sp.]
MSKEITKKIYFYRLIMKMDGIIVSASDVFAEIDKLSFNNGDRYYNLENGNKWAMYVDSHQSPIRARMGTRRENELPEIECDGNLTPLNIPPKSGLYEPTHFTLFPNNVVGVEYNHYGPRISSLKWYIPRKIPDIVDDVILLPLMKKDVLETIHDIGEIRSFSFAAQRDMGAFVKQLDKHLSAAFDALKETSDSEMIEIVLKSPRYSRDNIKLPLVDNLKKWLGISEVREGVDKLKINALDTTLDEYKTFDLLQEYIMSEKQVITIDDKHRTVNSNAMYAAIHQAYTDCKPEINRTIKE